MTNSGIERAIWETEDQEHRRERVARRPVRFDRTKSLGLEIGEYPEKGRTTRLTRIRAGLNLSLMSENATEHALLCEALGVPPHVSVNAPWAA